MPVDSPLVERARALAREAHQHQLRKASGAPYFTHLDGVAHILVDHGYDDDVTLAAAYLHDLVEDQPAYAERMHGEMPTEVVEVVSALTEQKLDASGHKRPKAERFADYVRGLEASSPAARRAKPVSCADRIHNTFSIVHDEEQGHSPFMQLATRPGELRDQLSILRRIYAPEVSQPLLASFDEAASKLDRTIERWLPGRAAMLAAEAHLGQFDKAGEPYIWHPMRLALNAASPEERIVALLHDVVEDTSITIEDLRREGFASRTLRALEHLARGADEDYDSFIERVARHRLATRVKLLDLADNSNLARLGAPNAQDYERVDKYRRASARLLEELGKRSLYLVLDEPSRARVAAHRTHAVLKGDHVTLAYRADPTHFSPDWVPGGHTPDSEVALSVTHAVRDEELEVFVVEIDGESSRPYDGGTLHLTVSRAPHARSRDANHLLETGVRTPLALELSGSIRWVDD